MVAVGEVAVERIAGVGLYGRRERKGPQWRFEAAGWLGIRWVLAV